VYFYQNKETKIGISNM